MRILIANSSPDPIYEQIVRQIKAQIIAGDLREGEPLPSIRKLAQDLQISVITTQAGLRRARGRGVHRHGGGQGHVRRRAERRVPPREAHEGGRGEAGGGGRGGPADGAGPCAAERDAPAAVRGGVMTPDHALELRGVGKSLPRLRAEGRVLRAAARLHLAASSVPTASGKTTIIKLIMNLVRREAGEIQVFGLDNRARRGRGEVAHRLRLRRARLLGRPEPRLPAPGARGVLPALERRHVSTASPASSACRSTRSTRRCRTAMQDEVRPGDGAVARRRPAHHGRADGGPRPGVPARAAQAPVGAAAGRRQVGPASRRTSRATSSVWPTSSRSSARGEIAFSLTRDELLDGWAIVRGDDRVVRRTGPARGEGRETPRLRRRRPRVRRRRGPARARCPRRSSTK